MEKSYLTERDHRLSRTGAGVAGALLIVFVMLRLMGAAVATHSALGVSAVAVGAILVTLWFWKGKASPRWFFRRGEFECNGDFSPTLKSTIIQTVADDESLSLRDKAFGS